MFVKSWYESLIFAQHDLGENTNWIIEILYISKLWNTILFWERIKNEKEKSNI